MNEIIILNEGFADSLDLLSDNEMDFVKGGTTHCGKGYSMSSSAIKCKCDYDGPDMTTDDQKPLLPMITIQ